MSSLAVRTARIEIAIPHDEKLAWYDLCDVSKRIANRMWQMWLVWHVKNDTAAAIRRDMDAFRKWKEDKASSEKPSWSVHAVSTALSNEMYHTLRAEFPDVHTRTMVLAMNKWQRTVSKRKSAQVQLPGWAAILFGHESVPSFSRPQPINVDNRNMKFLDGNQVECRLSLHAPRKAVVVIAKMAIAHRKAAWARTIVSRIKSGDYEFRGSAIVYEKNRHKWYLLLSYRFERVKQKFDTSSVLHLFPSSKAGRGNKQAPWVIVLEYGDGNGNGKKRQRFAYGEGRVVVTIRNIIDRERSSRRAHNRYAGSNTKGHGRERAIAVWTKLSSRWMHFQKNCNGQLAAFINRICERDRIGKVVYHKPKDQRRSDRFLWTSTGDSWDWNSVGSSLANRLTTKGIEYDETDWVLPAARRSMREVVVE